MGRRKKKIAYPEEAMEELIAQAVYLFREPYDDRKGRKDDLPSVRSVANEMGTTILRVRKLLISAGYYSTKINRKVLELFDQGLSMNEIMKETKLGQASVYSYLPYQGLAFNLDQTTVNADRLKMFRRRKKAVILLADHSDKEDIEEYLWKAVVAFEKYPLYTTRGLKFSYEMKRGRDGLPTEEILIDRKEKTITKSTINFAFHKALEIQKKEGSVSGPKRLGCFGASYLYPLFLRFGLISRTEE